MVDFDRVHSFNQYEAAQLTVQSQNLAEQDPMSKKWNNQVERWRNRPFRVS